VPLILLFLKKARQSEAGRHEIYYGAIFEISHNNVKPLLKGADNVFKGTIDSRLKDFILRIQAASIR
jgi:hypothetical protein